MAGGRCWRPWQFRGQVSNQCGCRQLVGLCEAGLPGPPPFHPQALEEDAAATQRRMDAANALISALGGEEVRWKAQAAQFSDTISRLIGDCAIASRWAGRGRLGVLGLGAVAQQLCLGSKLQPSPAWCHIARNPAAALPHPCPTPPALCPTWAPSTRSSASCC